MSVNDQIMEIYLGNVLYHYDFDLTSGIVEMEIVDRNGTNYTKALGLTAPCSFDELLERSFNQNFLGVWNVAHSEEFKICQADLLKAFQEGRRLVEATFYVPGQDMYNRINYYLIPEEESGKPHVYVSCVDITATEKNRKSVFGALQYDKSEIEEIVACAKLGIWRITLFDGEKPKMRATEAMFKIIGIEEQGSSEEEVYERWYSRIKKSSVPSVTAAITEMIEDGFAETTYTWSHPQKGDIVARIGGTSVKVEGKGVILRGYHSDITETVNAETKQSQLLAEALDEVKKQKQLLQEALDNYKEADYDRRTDFLTGLRNRQDMFDLLQDVLSGKRENISAMFMMDIDYFKMLNDNYGHVYGDECLRKIGWALKEYGQNNNLYFYRYGGEEMLGIYFGGEKSADVIAQELVWLIADLKLTRDDVPAKVVTVSLGYTTDNRRYEKMIDKADTAMYKAKGHGKNQAICYEDI